MKSDGMFAEISMALAEYRHNLFNDLFKTRSVSMTPGLVLTNILDINRTLAMHQELYNHDVVGRMDILARTGGRC